MTDARDAILGSLRASASRRIPHTAEAEAKVLMVPRGDESPRELAARFTKMAQMVDCDVHQAGSVGDAIQSILDIVGEERIIISWDLDHIPLDGLKEAFESRGIKLADPRDASVRIGLSGVEAALAATGSLVIPSGKGKPRTASYLPPIHVAVVRSGQIVPDLEAWVDAEGQADLVAFKEVASYFLVTGPSRTSDIGMELFKGMHGPGEVHIVMVTEGHHSD